MSDFYAGKTLSLLAGFPPGGGYDTYVRVLARHYGKFIPGHPAVVPSNMPGAGSLLAANYLYAKAPPMTALTLAMFAASAAMEPLLGQQVGAVRCRQVQLDRQHVAGHRLLRRLAVAGRAPRRSTR